MKKGYTFAALALCLVGIGFFIACGGGGSSGGKGSIKLKATLSNSSYNTASAKPQGFFAGLLNFVSKAYATAPLTVVNKIVAVPLEGGEFHGDMMSDSTTTDVAEDGSFSIDLSRHFDWLLLLMDTATGNFSGYVSLRASDTENLIQIPATTAKAGSEIELGTVTAAGDIALAQYTTNPADFSMTTDQLLTLARNDDLLKGAVNLVKNYDTATGLFYYLRPDFMFENSYASIENSFANVGTYQYKSYGFQLDSNQTAITMADVCGDGVPPVNLELYPPVASNISTTMPVSYFNNSTPFTNAGADCAQTASGAIEAWTPSWQFFASDAYEHVSFEFGTGLRGSIPSGEWLLKFDNITTGLFDVSVATPVAGNGKIKGPVPVIKAVTDGSRKITSVAVKWYTSSDGISYQELTDISVLKYLVGSGDIYLDGKDGSNNRRYESIHFDPSKDTSVTPSWTWYYGTGGTAAEQATSLGVFFNAAGVGHHLQYFRPSPL